MVCLYAILFISVIVFLIAISNKERAKMIFACFLYLLYKSFNIAPATAQTTPVEKHIIGILSDMTYPSI